MSAGIWRLARVPRWPGCGLARQAESAAREGR